MAKIPGLTDQNRRRNSNQGDNYIKNRKDIEEGTIATDLV